MDAVRCDSVYTPEDPIPLGIMDESRVYLSGRLARDPETGAAIDGITAETEQILSDIEQVLAASGTDISNTVQATLYLTDISDIDRVNEVYQRYMSPPYPARSAVEVSSLKPGFNIEIEVVAAR